MRACWNQNKRLCLVVRSNMGLVVVKWENVVGEIEGTVENAIPTSFSFKCWHLEKMVLNRDVDDIFNYAISLPSPSPSNVNILGGTASNHNFDQIFEKEVMSLKLYYLFFMKVSARLGNRFVDFLRRDVCAMGMGTVTKSDLKIFSFKRQFLRKNRIEYWFQRNFCKLSDINKKGHEFL